MTATQPAPSPAAPAEPRQYVARYFDGSLRVLTAEQVASDLRHAAYGDSDSEPMTLWTFLDLAPSEVLARATSSGYDSDDYADVRVELVNPATGAVLDVTGYRLDGRA